MTDALGVLLLGLGFASSILTDQYGLASAAMLAAGLVGLHRTTGKRSALVLIGAVVALWVLQHFWEILPVDTYKLGAEHKMLYDAPGVVATAVDFALLAAIPIVARKRVGHGLMVLSLAALAFGVIAKGPLSLTDKGSGAALLFGAIAGGWLGVAARVVAIVFLAAAFEPTTPRLEKRGLVIVAVIGAALFAAVYETLPEHFTTSEEPYPALTCGAMLLAWILSAIGFAGVARAGGGVAAWIAMALSILQIPMFGFGLVLSDKSQSVRGAVSSSMIFGLLAIGIAAVSAPSMGARTARGLAGILALSALFGTLVSFAYLMGGMFHVVSARGPFGPLHLFAFPIVGHAAVAWAACLAYLVAPPSAKVTA